MHSVNETHEYNIPRHVRLAGLARRYDALVEQLLPLSDGEPNSSSDHAPGNNEASPETQRLVLTLRLVVRILLQSQDEDLVLLNVGQRSVLESTLRRSELLLQYIVGQQQQQQQCAGEPEEDLVVEVTILSEKDEANPLLQWSLVQGNLMQCLDQDQLAAEEADLFHMVDTPIPSAATTEQFANAATSNRKQLGDAIRQEWRGM